MLRFSRILDGVWTHACKSEGLECRMVASLKIEMTMLLLLDAYLRLMTSTAVKPARRGNCLHGHVVLKISAGLSTSTCCLQLAKLVLKLTFIYLTLRSFKYLCI